MRPCLRERKPSLKYKFYEEYESDEGEPEPESDDSDSDINYCHDCDIVFEDRSRLYKHLLRHVKQPQVRIEPLSVRAGRAPIRITLKGCGSGDFEIVQSPASSTGALSPVYNQKEFSAQDQFHQQQPSQSSVRTLQDRTSGKTDDDYEEKYIIPDSDPVAGGTAAAASTACVAEQGGPGQGQVVAKTEVEEEEEEEEDDGHVDQQEEEEEENAMNVSFSPNYAGAEHIMHHEENSMESQLSSNKATSDGGYGSSIPGAEPTPPPEPSPTPDHLMPKIRIKSSGLLMAPERESPQGLTITEITEGDDVQAQQEQDPFAGVEAWSGGGGASGMEDPLRLPDTIETDGNIISNLFTNNTDRAKDLGLTSSDSEFISLDGMGGSGGGSNAMAVYNPSQQSQQSNNLASVSSALVGLPMQQLAQQVSRLQQPSQGGQQMHQQNVLINIQQFPQAPQQQQQQQPVQQQQQQQVQPYGMYGHHYQGYQPGYHQPYAQPYQQPNLYYAAPPPAYPAVAPAQHMPPPAAPVQHPQQPQPAYILQPAPQQQQQQQQPQQPIILGAVSQLTPAQHQQTGQGQQQVQPYGQQQGQQVAYAGQQQQQGAPQSQQQYNQGTYGQPAVHRPPQPGQPQQPQQAIRMGAPRAPGQPQGGPRMTSPRGGQSMVGTRTPYSPRGGAAGGRPPMVTRGGRGGPQMMQSMRGRPRTLLNHGQQNGIRQPGNQQGTSPVKRTPEQMASIAAKRRRMETTATVKVEADDDEDDCEVVSVQQREANKLPKIQSVQGAVPENSESGGVMHLSDSITLSVRQPAPPPPSPKAKSDAKQVANVLASRGITVTAAPKETKQSEPVPISLNKSVCLIQNKQGKKDDHTPTVDLTDDVRVPAPKTLPPISSNASTNGSAGSNQGTSVAPPQQPFKCDQCPARYGSNVALVKHRQLTHKNCNQMDYGVPLIDLRQPGIMSKLTNFGIYNYIPLPAANVSGMFALPVISMNAVKNNVNLSALGNSMLTLGPIRKIQKAGGGPAGPTNTQQSPPRGRPPSNPSTPTKQQQ